MKMSARTAIIALASVAMLIHAANAAEIKRSAPKVSSNSDSNSQAAIDHDELFQRSQVESTSFLQTMAKAGAKAKWSGEHGYCELCIYSVHQVQYGALPTCGGTTKTFSYSSCSQVVQSMLAYAHDVMHLISYGCYQYDPYKGWQTVKPCPAHVICGRLPNIYDQAKETMCPADYHFRFPHALASLAPKVSNPLLPYAIKQYTNNAKSSILQEANAPSQEPGKSITSMNAGLRGSAPASQSGYPSSAFPRNAAPGSAYAEITNGMLAQATPNSLTAQTEGKPASERSTFIEEKSKEKKPRFLLDGIDLPFKKSGEWVHGKNQ